MRIELSGGKYVLKSDAHCMWLAKNKTAKETGKEYEDNISGYHPTLGGLIDSTLRKRILLSEAETLAELRNETEAAARELKEVFGELEKVLSVSLRKTSTKREKRP
jgi:SpoVK/Ycf46/Vps4 family AAA+-type ATPase